MAEKRDTAITATHTACSICSNPVRAAFEGCLSWDIESVPYINGFFND